MIQLWISVGMVVLFVVYHGWRWIKRSRGAQPVAIQNEYADVPETFSVSFLVPAWNAADAIPTFVHSFLLLSIPNKQLILCAGGRDQSYVVAKQFESHQILVLEQTPGMGKQRALRLSLPLATGNVIFLTDIDCHMEDEIVHRMIASLSTNRSVVTGGIRPLRHQHGPLVFLQWDVRRCSSPQHISETNGLLGANTALLKSTLHDIGGFSADAITGTDYTLAKELLCHGHKIWYIPNCEIATEFPDTYLLYVHKQSRWLRNVLMIGPRYGAWSELRAIAVTLLLPYIFVGLLIGGIFLPLLFTVLLLVVVHAVLNRVHYLSMQKHRIPLHATCLSVVADLVASLQAGYQTVFHKHVW